MRRARKANRKTVKVVISLSAGNTEPPKGACDELKSMRSQVRVYYFSESSGDVTYLEKYQV